MEYQNGHSGGGRILSTTSSSSEVNRSSSNNSNLSHNMHIHSDPMHSWWESVSKARSRIHSLISLLPSHPSSDSLSSLLDSDRPAHSLLDSSAVYSAVTSSLSGSGDDPLCQWLYDTFQQDDADLRLVVFSFVPVIAGLYLTAVHRSSTTTPNPATPSLAGFEAVLLALYSAETKSRAGKPLLVTVPSPAFLAHNPSLYHSATAGSSPSAVSAASSVVSVMSPPLEPQVGIKSTKRASIVGVAFHCFYTHISHMPPWSKIDLCRFAASWAGDPCSCIDDNSDSTSETSLTVALNNQHHHEQLPEAGGSIKIPLPWELLQPMLRILAHCLLAPPQLISDTIKDAASIAISRLNARASHDLSSQAILATRSLLQLHQRACATAKAAAIAAAASYPTTPTSAHKKTTDLLLVSK